MSPTSINHLLTPYKSFLSPIASNYYILGPNQNYAPVFHELVTSHFIQSQGKPSFDFDMNIPMGKLF